MLNNPCISILLYKFCYTLGLELKPSRQLEVTSCTLTTFIEADISSTSKMNSALTI